MEQPIALKFGELVLSMVPESGHLELQQEVLFFLFNSCHREDHDGIKINPIRALYAETERYF